MSYNHNILGKENDNDNIDISKEDDRIEKDNEQEDNVPFILPFNAVPFS